MKNLTRALAASLIYFVATCSICAQSGRARDANVAAANGEANKPIVPNAADARTAAQLYEEVNTYVDKKFAEFTRLHMPYDAQIANKIEQEQRDLAARNAATIAARKIEGQDVYYLGLLYNRARNNEAALATMRRFLKENPNVTGEPAQNARGVVVIHAAKQVLLVEAETQLAVFEKNQPQLVGDRYELESPVDAAYFRAKDYERSLPHAQEMMNAAMLAAKDKTPTQRDVMLSFAVMIISEADLKLKKRDDAIAAVQNLRHLALSLPSGNLY
jgi:hypothetical protein